MAIISQETFEKFTKEEKESVRKLYEHYEDDTLLYQTEPPKLVKHNLESLFGKENLEPKPIIKTWNDVILTAEQDEEYGNIYDNYIIVRSVVHCPEILKKRLEATYRIGKIIELGYGIVSEEEWRNDVKPKLCIVPLATDKGFKIVTRFYIDGFVLPTFHTTEQANEFLSYTENVQLLEDYYGLDTKTIS